MSDLREAAKMALITLEEKLAVLEPTKYAETIEALRQALSNEFNPDWNQVEALQESLREHMAEIQRLRQALAQPEQKYATKVLADGTFVTEPLPLYTAPPKREWVGVTYDEVYEFVCTTDSYINLAKAIEAKLKEKNT